MNRNRMRRHTTLDLSDRLLWGLLVAFLLAAIVTAYITFLFVRSLVAGWVKSAVAAPEVEGQLASASAPLNPQALTVPLQSHDGPVPIPWDGASRVNILVMGLDYGDWEGREGPARTDSMILFTLDPLTQTAGMLSIPRDLWVNIPGYGYNKINTAYFLGEAEGLPGGGPGLAIRTVEEFLGVPINFYAQIDFRAFEAFIDELGGIEVEVIDEISVDPIGPENTLVLQPGLQVLDGPTTLAYARNRDTIGNDFDRAQRQQQVIMAIRDRILSLDMLPLLIQKAPILYSQLASGVHTNMTLQQTISLAWLAQQIPTENIQRVSIGPDQVIMDVSPDGFSILRPIPDEVRLLRDEVFTNTGPAIPAIEDGDPQELMQAENATVSVLNGTSLPGLAAVTSEYLTSQGVNVILIDNAQESYEYTTLIDYRGKLNTVQYLVELMHIQPDQVYSRYDLNSPVDIAILLGNDWANDNPMQ
jgi:LCP family protein required for cell wall assembly